MTTFPDYGLPGLSNLITLDSVDFTVNPASSQPRPQRMQSIVEMSDGSRKRFRPYVRNTFPALIRRMHWSLEWENVHGTLLERLHEVEMDGLEHTLAVWIREFLTWSAFSGQQILELPYRRLVAPRVLGRDSVIDWPLAFSVEGTERTVVYKTSVADGDTVPDGEVWVSDTQPKMKTSPALALGDTALLRYYPLYRVQVDESAAAFPSTIEESATIDLGEVSHSA